MHKYPWQTSYKQCGMGSIPYRMYNICKKRRAPSLLGARRQNLSRLRVEKPGRCAGSRQIIPAALYTPKRPQVQSRRCLAARWGQTGHPKKLSRQSHVAFFACTSWAVSSLYLPKTAFATLAMLVYLQSEDLTCLVRGALCCSQEKLFLHRN
jgi:hypothetical protein